MRHLNLNNNDFNLPLHPLGAWNPSSCPESSNHPAAEKSLRYLSEKNAASFYPDGIRVVRRLVLLRWNMTHDDLQFHGVVNLLVGKSLKNIFFSPKNPRRLRLLQFHGVFLKEFLRNHWKWWETHISLLNRFLTEFCGPQNHGKKQLGTQAPPKSDLDFFVDLWLEFPTRNGAARFFLRETHVSRMDLWSK